MNLTKKSISILLMLAFVFTTIVCVSVGASIDFPIHESVVTYTAVSNQNGKKSATLGDGKIAYLNIEKVSLSANMSATASNLTQLIETAKENSQTIKIDIYSEFESLNNYTAVTPQFKFGNISIMPSNVVSYNNGDSVVTAEFDVSKLNASSYSTVYMKIAPQTGDKLTGTFYMSVPYLNSAPTASTVNVTQFQTTTTKPAAEYNGTIDIHDTPVTIIGFQNNYGGAATVTIGDENSTYSTKFATVRGVNNDNGQNQIQALLKYNGFETLYNQALEEKKNICFDVYTNNFTYETGNTASNIYAYYRYKFGNLALNEEDINARVYPNKSKTFAIPVTELESGLNNMFVQIQQYTSGTGKLANVEFIITAPYLEGAAILANGYQPSTTAPVTSPKDESYSTGDKITVYNNGVTYGNNNWIKGTNLTVTNDASNKYFTVLGSGNYEGSGQMIQINNKEVSGLSTLREKAINNKEAVCIDFYCASLQSFCYVQVSFNQGGGSTGDKQRTINPGKKQTLTIDPSLIDSESDKITFFFKKYEGDNTIINANIIVSVPYVASDKSTSTTETPAEIVTTAAPTDPTVNYHDTPDDNTIALKIKDTPVSISRINYSKPAENGTLSDSNGNKKVAYLTSKTPYSGEPWQLEMTTNNLGDLIYEAAQQNKNICIDFYGTFNSRNSTDVYALTRVSFGGNKWYGNETAIINDSAGNSKYIKIENDKVTTQTYNAKELLKLISSYMSGAADFEAEGTSNITLNSDVTPTVVGVNETFTGEPENAKYHSFKDVKVGDTIEYTLSGVSEGNFNVALKTRDFNGAKFDVYVNGTKVNGLDLTSSAKTYSTHNVASNIALSGTTKVKLVCTKAAVSGASSITLDKISLSVSGSNVEQETARKVTTIKFMLNRSWKDPYTTGVNYGRFYMSVPYIEGAESEEASVPTTTTTRNIPTNSTTKPGAVMPGEGWDMDKIDLSHVDCRIPSYLWGSSTSGQASTDVDVDKDGRYFELQLKNGGTAQRCSAKVNINGGNKNKSFASYVDYAKATGSWIAMDIYPQFTTPDPSCPFAYIQTSWKWPIGDYSFRVTSGQRYTFLISPDDVPESVLYETNDEGQKVEKALTEIEFAFMNYSFGSFKDSKGTTCTGGIINPQIFVTAPYITATTNLDATTTTTTSYTTKKQVTVTSTYPSYNPDGTTTFRILDAEVPQGGSVRVPLRISGNQGLYSASLSLKFNKNALTLSGYELGDVFDNVSVSAVSDANRNGVINIQMEQNNNDTTKDGYILWLEFDADIRDEASLIEFAGGDGYIASNFFNSKIRDVACSFVSGYVVIGDETTRVTEPDPYFANPYPTTNSGTTKFTISSVNENYNIANAGKDYSVFIRVDGNAGLKGAKFYVKYDSNLQFISSNVVKADNVFNLLEYNFTPTETKQGVLDFNIYPKTNQSLNNSTKNGRIIELKFRIIDYKVGNYSVEFGGNSYTADAFVNTSGIEVPCSFVSGGINITSTALSKPTISSLTLSAKTSAKIVWNKINGAVKYDVYQSTGSSNSFKKVKSVTTNSCTVSGLKAGIKYNFKVVAVGKSSNSALSSVKSITTLKYSTKPAIKSVKGASKAMTVKIKKKITGATGYQVQYSTNSKFKSAKKTAFTGISKKVKKLSSGKTYYVRVRTYNIVNGKKTYGKWSASKSVSVK